MTNKLKLLSFNTVDGNSISLHPNHVIAMIPNQMVNQTIIHFLSGNVVIEMPYTRSLKLWQWALDGSEAIPHALDG